VRVKRTQGSHAAVRAWELLASGNTWACWGAPIYIYIYIYTYIYIQIYVYIYIYLTRGTGSVGRGAQGQ